MDLLKMKTRVIDYLTMQYVEQVFVKGRIPDLFLLQLQKGDQHHDDSVTIKNQEVIQIISCILKVSTTLVSNDTPKSERWDRFTLIHFCLLPDFQNPQNGEFFLKVFFPYVIFNTCICFFHFFFAFL